MKISIIIPTLNEAAHIRQTLQSIDNQELSTNVSIEVLIVDGGSEDETMNEITKFFETNDSLPVRVFRSERGRALQQNCGAAFASGEILLFLHADSLISKNLISELAAKMNHQHHQFGYFYLKFDSAHPLAELYSTATKLNSILTHYGDSGIFLRRDYFEAIGKFPEQELMEDFELLIRARKLSRGLLITSATVTTSARRYEKNGYLKQQALNAFLVTAYLFGVSPSWLKTFYQNNRD